MTNISVVKDNLTTPFASYNSQTRRENLDQEEGEAIWAACRANGFHPVSIQAQEKTPGHAKWPVFALRNKREWDASAPGVGLVAGALDAERKDPTGSPLRVPGVGRTLFLDFDIHAESRPGLDGAAVRDAFLSLPTVRRLLAEGALLRYREVCGSGFVLVVRNAGDVGNTRPRYHADREHWPAIGTDEAGRERFDYGSPAGMDIIAAGGQAVCFAIHPSGAPYLWADGRSPANVHLDTLPTVDAETVARLIEEVTAALATFHLAPRSKTYAARFKDSPIRAARVTPISQSDRDWLHDTTIELDIFGVGSDRRNFWRNAARVFCVLGDTPEAALERWAEYYSPSEDSHVTFEKAEAEAVAQIEKPAGAEDALGPGAYLRWLQAAARDAGRLDVADRIGDLMSSHHISDGKAFDSIAEADGALPAHLERKKKRQRANNLSEAFDDWQASVFNAQGDDLFDDAKPLNVTAPALAAALDKFAEAEGVMGEQSYIKATDALNALTKNPCDGADMTPLMRFALDGELIEEPPPIAPRKEHLQPLVSGGVFLSEYVPLDYVIDRILPRSYLAALTAKTHHGKTTWLSLLTCAIVLGDGDFIGREVEGGRVLYVCYENPDDFRLKLQAAVERYGLSKELLDERLVVIRADMTPAEIYKQAKKLGPFDLAIVDTLQAAASVAGVPTNDNDEMLKLARGFRACFVSLPGNPAVLVAAHPIKSAGEDDLVPYGGGSLLNEFDINLTLWFDKKTGCAKLHHGKLRGGSAFEPIRFEYQDHLSSLKDKKGNRLKQPVAVLMDEKRAAAKAAATRAEVLGRDAATLEAFLKDPKITDSALGEKLGLSRQAAGNRKKALIKAGHLTEKIDDSHFVTDAGKQTLAEREAAIAASFEPADGEE